MKAPLSSTGLIDRRLFTGEQKLHALMDDQTNLWHFRYDARGKLPPELDSQTFTTYSALLKFATEYFSKRNIKVAEVL
ncbi:MAG TPA: hypothetical protein VNZ45_14495 [Bacteroidia bacterium]|nr:hypothetical protein [Bacteroidia bacterium]